MNLELIETKALLDELFVRFDHAVFAGMKVKEDGKPEHHDGQIYESRRTMGNTRVCQGLCFDLMLFQQEQWLDRANSVEDDSTR